MSGLTNALTITPTAAEVEAFQRDGYITYDRITTEDELEFLRAVYDRIFETRAGRESGHYFDLGSRGEDGREVLPQVLMPEEKFPELADTLYRRNCRELGARLLGVDAGDLTLFGHMILKPAGYGRETPWHQDEAYWEPTHDHRGLSVWMPLEPASIESGCMQFVPGSHLEKVRSHRHIDDDPKVAGLMTDEQDPDGAVACPLPAGGVSVHHQRILHHAGPNRTDRPRRAYIQVVRAPSIPRAEPYARPWQRP